MSMTNIGGITKILEKIKEDSELVGFFNELIKTLDKAEVSEDQVQKPGKVYLYTVLTIGVDGKKYYHPLLLPSQFATMEDAKAAKNLGMSMVSNAKLLSLQENTMNKMATAQLKRNGYECVIMDIDEAIFKTLEVELDTLISTAMQKIEEAANSLIEAKEILGIPYSNEMEKLELVGNLIDQLKIAGVALTEDGVITEGAKDYLEPSPDDEYDDDDYCDDDCEDDYDDDCEDVYIPEDCPETNHCDHKELDDCDDCAESSCKCCDCSLHQECEL